MDGSAYNDLLRREREREKREPKGGRKGPRKKGLVMRQIWSVQSAKRRLGEEEVARIALKGVQELTEIARVKDGGDLEEGLEEEEQRENDNDPHGQ